jgi:hypothetical protein
MIVALAALCMFGASDRLLAQRAAAHAPKQVALTDANFAQFSKASDKLTSYMKAHHEADLSATDEDYASIDEAAKKLCEPHPDIRAAIASAGLTCSEYMALTVSLETAAALSSLSSAGAKATTTDPTAAANVVFYRTHEAAAKRVLAEIGAGDGPE